jgi:hypothetical protein
MKMTLSEMRKYKGRCFVRVFSGRDVDLLAPDPDDILVKDIVYHLSRIERYNGGCKFSCSVALHSLMVASILPEPLKLAGLLHDASEAYMGDTVGPLKELLPEYREIEANLMKVILTKFDAPYPLPMEIKAADKMVLAAEMRQVNGWHDLADQIGVIDADVTLYDLPVFAVSERFQAALEKYL